MPGDRARVIDYAGEVKTTTSTWLVPATYGYPIGAASWVLRLNQRVKRSGKHNLAW